MKTAIETRGRKKVYDALLPTCAWSKDKMNFLDSVAKLKGWTRREAMRISMERGLKAILEETIE
jgi:hypothetical protein